MKIEEALRILHPDTTSEALSEVEYFGGFESKEKVLDAVNSACLLACSELQKILSGELVPADRISNGTVTNAIGVKANPTNAEVIAHALLCFDSLEPEEQENVAEYIDCCNAAECLFDGKDVSLCAPCKVKWLQQKWED